jgi:hypothetical protein
MKKSVKIADADQINFRSKRVLKTSFDWFFTNSDIVPIPINAAATNLAMIGSAGRLNRARV